MGGGGVGGKGEDMGDHGLVLGGSGEWVGGCGCGSPGRREGVISSTKPSCARVVGEGWVGYFRHCVGVRLQVIYLCATEYATAIYTATIIETTDKKFDDFAGGEIDQHQLKSILNLKP